jgi:hypothetical protein
MDVALSKQEASRPKEERTPKTPVGLRARKRAAHDARAPIARSGLAALGSPTRSPAWREAKGREGLLEALALFRRGSARASRRNPAARGGPIVDTAAQRLREPDTLASSAGLERVKLPAGQAHGHQRSLGIVGRSATRHAFCYTELAPCGKGRSCGAPGP